jgi:hypothetical protein
MRGNVMQGVDRKLPGGDGIKDREQRILSN